LEVLLLVKKAQGLAELSFSEFEEAGQKARAGR
jgi:hypothetical protein